MSTISQALLTALTHHQAGRLEAAEEIYRQILAAEPNQADAIHLLGVLAQQAGKLDEAVARCRRALELRPEYAEAHNSLGIAFKDQGKLADAADCFRRAQELKPAFAEAHVNLGVVLKEQGNLDEAVVCYRRALELKPEYAEAHNNLGVTLKEQGKLDEAIACFHRALELKPDYAEAHNNLGVALRDQGKLDEAAASCCRAVQLKPDFAVAINNFGSALRDQGRFEEAVVCYRRALELKPDYAEARNNLGNALKDQGKINEAIACYDRALELKPDYAGAHSNRLFALQYRADVTPEALAEAHAEFDRRHAAPASESSLGCGKILHAEREGYNVPLRLGFVSADLGRHPVGYFLVRALENLDNERFKTICYSDRAAKDDMTRRIRAAVSDWHDTIGLSDQRLAERIRADRIDILFDLAGHTAQNRLLVFARKPAAVQITWAGYVGTTGLASMDYLLADRYEVPPGAEQYYRERVLRMPDGYVCYDPPPYAPPVAPLPALEEGYITLGCFNNPCKITPQAIEVWAAILRRLPHARLLLKFKGWDDCGIARRYMEMFAAQGIEPGRLELRGYSLHAALLAEYNRVDLALDSFPYSGGLTTCEALWMGVPVITCPLETFASRHSLSHLSNLGLTETIAHDLDDYVERAVALASDLPQLAALRAGLRDRMAASPLCDGKRFAVNLAAVLVETAS